MLNMLNIRLFFIFLNFTSVILHRSNYLYIERTLEIHAPCVTDIFGEMIKIALMRKLQTGRPNGWLGYGTQET